MPIKAVTYRGSHDITIEETEEPEIEDPKEVILEVTTTAICGSDLHMYEGRAGAEPGMVFGHEIMGTVEKVGEGVETLSPGDRVVLPFNISCGFCKNCEQGFTNACLNTESESPGAAYGYVGMGPYQGGQAEKVRVPYADFNALKLPPGTEKEEDFILLADVFPTGWHGTELAELQPGESIVIFGAGPVGLMAAYSAKLKGASEIYVVDREQSRLDLAKEYCDAVPINFEEVNPPDRIKEIHGSMIDKGVDAVGYQAIEGEKEGDSPYDKERENPSLVINHLIETVKATGKIGVVGVYTPEDPNPPEDVEEQGQLNIKFGNLFEKGIQMGTGQCPVKKYNRQLRDMIIKGDAEPSFLISHIVDLEEAPEMYERFDKREEGVTKVLLKP